MNQQLQNFAREQLKMGLLQCTEAEQTLFKRMYAFPSGYCQRSEQPHLDMSIDEVVTVIPEEKLDWAMQQVQNTLKR